MTEFINKIRTADEKEYDIQDSRVNGLEPRIETVEAEIAGKASHEEAAEAKSKIEGNSLVIPEQEGPKPVIEIDGVAYFHKQEFDLEELAASSQTTYNLLTGEHPYNEEGTSKINVSYAGPGPDYLAVILILGLSFIFKLAGASQIAVDFTSRAFTVVDTKEEVTDNTKICLPTCSAYYGFLSEDGKTFISYYNLKSDGAPSYVDSIKQGNAVMPIKDVRLPDATAADVGKVLAVDENGELVLQQASSGGTKLYKHSVRLKRNPLSAMDVQLILTTPEPITANTNVDNTFSNTLCADTGTATILYKIVQGPSNSVTFGAPGNYKYVFKYLADDGTIKIDEFTGTLTEVSDTVTEL